MYHGIQERRFNIYTDKTIQRGWRFQKLHIYTCEVCGSEAAVLHQATEPFYCHGECEKHRQTLISIEPAPQAYGACIDCGLVCERESDGRCSDCRRIRYPSQTLSQFI